MELKDVEMSLGVQFPALFQTISGSGMMDYLIHSRSWVEDKIKNNGDLYFQIVGEAAQGDHEIHSDYIKAHIRWLSDEHKRLLAETPVSDIWEHLPEPQEFNIWI